MQSHEDTKNHNQTTTGKLRDSVTSWLRGSEAGRFPRKLALMSIARRYLIGGRVQGVGFRYFVRDRARREGVRGWVRNLFDGRVEIFAVGETGRIARFEADIRSGPAGARVAHVDVQDVREDATGDQHVGFDVRSDG